MIVESYHNKLPYSTAIMLKNKGDIKISMYNGRFNILYNTPTFKFILSKTNILTTFRLYLYLALFIFIFSIIFSFNSDFWWAFIPGLGIAGWISHENKKDFYHNTLEEALVDEELYNALASTGTLMYIFKEETTASHVFKNIRILNEIKERLPRGKHKLIDALSEEKKEELIRKYCMKTGGYTQE